MDRALPVFVSRTEAKTPEQRNLFGERAAFVRAGGIAVYLQGGGATAPWGVGGKALPLLPINARSQQAIGHDWFPDYDLRRRHYRGPGDTWWGADLAIAPLGKGRCIILQLRLVENLGRDPVADRILFNLIQFASR